MTDAFFNDLVAKKAYLLPWTDFDNPNAWIEPTGVCQLKCPGCYRGLDKTSPAFNHRSLEDMKREVDSFIEKRNVQTISIAGGEPLLYPKIFELIKYITNSGLKSILYTNGIALNFDVLNKLKKSGLTIAVLHIDRFQNISGRKTDDQVLSTKNEYCHLFREVKGVNLGFIQPINKENLDNLSQQYNFYLKNYDIVSLVVFTIYRELVSDNEEFIENYVKPKDVAEKLIDFGWEPCSYLNSTIKEVGPSWIFSISAFNNNRLLGFFSGNWHKKVHSRYRKYKKKHLFITKKNYFSFNKNLLFFYFSKLSFKIIFNFFKNFLKGKTYIQTTLIIKPPEKINKSWSKCDGCPDAMYYKKKLIPSCLFEKIKKNNFSRT